MKRKLLDRKNCFNFSILLKILVEHYSSLAIFTIFILNINMLYQKYIFLSIQNYFVTGNHDHWTMDFMNETLTHKVHPDDVSIEISGKKFFLTHGDGILSWDVGYRLLKKVIRSRIFVWLYRCLHPAIGYGIAHSISKKGRHYDHSPEYNQNILNELKTFTDKKINEGHDIVITGHYHQATIENVNSGKLVVLGDWLQYFSYAVFDGNDIKLKFWNADA